MPDQYSSTAQDLKRGKPTEIDYLNGYVVRQGTALGIPTPTNLTLQVMVKARETHQQPHSLTSRLPSRTKVIDVAAIVAAGISVACE